MKIEPTGSEGGSNRLPMSKQKVLFLRVKAYSFLLKIDLPGLGLPGPTDVPEDALVVPTR